jgi:hypothetical protein
MSQSLGCPAAQHNLEKERTGISPLRRKRKTITSNTQLNRNWGWGVVKKLRDYFKRIIKFSFKNAGS